MVRNQPRHQVPNDRCKNLVATQESFNNYEDGSQDFVNACIKSPKITNSFNNKGSGNQVFTGTKILCYHNPILPNFQQLLARFNYDGNISQTFSGFSFSNFLDSLPRAIEKWENSVSRRP